MSEEIVEKKKTSPLVIGLLVACIILASGVGYLVYTKMNEPPSEHAQRAPGVLLKLGDAKEGLIINVGGVNSGRYLKASIILELKPEKDNPTGDGKTLTVEEAKILDTVIQVLRAQRVEDFEPGKQEHLKELIKHEVGQLIGEDKVYEVYITNFILQ